MYSNKKIKNSEKIRNTKYDVIKKVESYGRELSHQRNLNLNLAFNHESINLKKPGRNHFAPRKKDNKVIDKIAFIKKIIMLRL